jgi:hypothetical protein
MMVLGCLTHWYVSLLYVVPVLGVGGWGWWSARRMSRNRRGARRESSATLDPASR